MYLRRLQCFRYNNTVESRKSEIYQLCLRALILTKRNQSTLLIRFKGINFIIMYMTSFSFFPINFTKLSVIDQNEIQVYCLAYINAVAIQ